MLAFIPGQIAYDTLDTLVAGFEKFAGNNSQRISHTAQPLREVIHMCHGGMVVKLRPVLARLCSVLKPKCVRTAFQNIHAILQASHFRLGFVGLLVHCGQGTPSTFVKSCTKQLTSGFSCN
jgi:hypothetical protein